MSICTLGCKVNLYESKAIEELFVKEGYDIVSNDEFADVYIINTCTVTNMSDRKSRQFIRKSKKHNKNSILVVTGCYSQISPEEILKIEEVDILIGTNEKNKITNIINNYSGDKVSTVDDIMKVKEFEEMTLSNLNEKTRAFIKIQDGCQQFCSYCIIPYARGPIRSRKIENIISEVKSLVEHGYKEFVLTGIHVASYGKDFENISLIDVLKEINKIDGVKRIRMSSIEPLIMTSDFIKELSQLDKICNHFHLSLQSGCDSVLKRMNRKYDTKTYKDIVLNLRAVFEDVSVTTDVITGFPGETKEEFEQTYEFLKDIKLSQMHVFKYSKRDGTKAAKMDNQVLPETKTKRSKILLELNKSNEDEFRKNLIGKTLDILFEKEYKENNYEGLSTNYIRVSCYSKDNIENQIKKVKIKDINEEYLIGELI
ncbi:MAG: tRNA (N(6)-L-threonylcarbamoyladenosine(37)-C(2))-methylthiotransferase MtaB [Peptostreptococcaceae bacterium]|nr:tRNA (N(6)-L-threonylcarbamoyladenosine(37)-C(2))-methylthiotransferase MtaB [Peptostreptococcaceae bacterium]